MTYKKIRAVISVAIIAVYFIVFYAPFWEISKYRMQFQAIYIIAICVIRGIISFVQNKIAKKRGENLPYPEFPWF